MRRAPAGAAAGLREIFSGPMIRALTGIRDVGEAILARVRNADGGPHTNTDGDADVWVHTVDELTGMPVLGRLHIPGGILFALPEAEDTCLVVRPRDAHGPGMAYVVHGDGGDASRFPAWIASKVGLFTKKVLRLESSSDAVEIQAGAGKDIALNGGSMKAARVTDPVRIGTLSGANGSGPVSFIFTPFDADGVPGTPTEPTATITIVGIISNSGGAPHVKA
jgi:hypothetical protein